MILKWLYKKPHIMTISNKKYKTLKIQLIIKNFEDLVNKLNILQKYPEVYKDKWDIQHNLKLEDLTVEKNVILHNLIPTNEKIDIVSLNELIDKQDFALLKRKVVFAKDYLLNRTNLISINDFIKNQKENEMNDILSDDLDDDELQDAIGETIVTDQYFQAFIDKCQITGHAVFIYNIETEDIDLFEFHNFKDFYENLKRLLTVYQKDLIKYSVSEELLSVQEYELFLNLFGPFKNIENLTTVEDLNQWIFDGRLLLQIENSLKLNNV